MKKNIIFGTAGHIDHGKSSLVEALTGTNPDRLKEEKERGITIDLGFAFMENDDIFISFVDVPGHEKLVKNMIAGATGFDACLFVVDLNEGIKPQTVEHANILKTLGINKIIIAGSKSDLLKTDEIKGKLNDIKDFFEQRGFKNIYTCAVSIYQKETIDNLKKLLFQVASEIQTKNADLPFLLRIDRVFSSKGFGTVVTGTCISGNISVGSQISLLPQNKTVKIKGLHVNNQNVEKAVAGQRVALNLSGVSKDEIHRGNLLSEEKSLIYTNEIYTSIEVFEINDFDIALKHNKNIAVYIGTAHLTAKLIILDKKIIKNGEKALCRLKLSEPYAPFTGEKFIIRGKSPQISIAGGKVLSISKYDFNKYDLIKALTLLDNSDTEGFLNFFTSKHKKGISIPPVLQFIDNYNKFNEFIKETNIVFEDDFLISKEYTDEIICLFQNKLRQNKEIFLDDIKKYGAFPKQIAEQIEKEIIKKAQSLNYVLNGRKLKKEKKTDFELLCEKVLKQMNKNIWLSNSSLIAEEFKLDTKTAQNCIKFLQNRSLIFQIEKNVWMSKRLYETILKKIKLHCIKNNFIDIKSLKQIIDAPRKILVPILDSLDKTDEFINKDNKRYLKSKIK